MVEVNSIKCAECGAQLRISPGQSIIRCEYCDTLLEIQDEQDETLASSTPTKPSKPKGTQLPQPEKSKTVEKSQLPEKSDIKETIKFKKKYASDGTKKLLAKRRKHNIFWYIILGLFTLGAIALLTVFIVKQNSYYHPKNDIFLKLFSVDLIITAALFLVWFIAYIPLKNKVELSLAKDLQEFEKKLNSKIDQSIKD